MAYIGAEPVPGQNREVDDISSSFNGSTTAFTLQVSSVNVSPESANNIIVSIGGVIQNPGTDYTVAGSTITFTTNPASGLSFFGLVLGQSIDTEGTADNSITSAMIIDQAVTLAKLPHGTGSNDGKFLRANNGADPSFETVSSVGGATGVDFNDDVKARFGASNDLNIYHSSSANKSIIETVAGGNLDIGSTHNADVQIKTNSVNRFNFGAGGFAPLANNTYELGTSSLRWSNIYTNDLNLSNEGSSNDVDGTWGNYTIQEGAEDLFLINKRNGKKYKFNLTEVS